MNYLGYENYIYKSSYTKNAYNKRKKMIFKFFIIIVILIVLGILLFLNIDKLSVLLGLNKQLVCEKQTFYMLKYDTYDDLEKAYIASNEVKNVGGGGFIKQENNEFNLIIATYPTEEKASIIKERLLSQNVICTLEKITVDSFILKDSPSINDYKDLLKAHINIYNELYSLFEKYENDFSSLYFKQKINDLYLNYKNKLDSFLKTRDLSNELNIISIYLSNLINHLESLVNLDSQNYNWTIEYTLIKIVYEYQSMLKNINISK